jgi:hypothetical protein
LSHSYYPTIYFICQIFLPFSCFFLIIGIILAMMGHGEWTYEETGGGDYIYTEQNLGLDCMEWG